MKFFTTLSLAEKVCKEDLQKFLNKNCEKWLYVEEQGKQGTNYHLHIYLDSQKWKTTDVLTRSIRKLYPEDFIESLDSTRRLVVTKIAKSMDKAVQYMMKEQVSIENLKYFNFDKKYLQKHFKISDAENKVKNNVLLSLIKAPYVLNDYLPHHTPLCADEIIKGLSDLMREGYITHHLVCERQIEKILFGVKALRKTKNYFSKDNIYQ